MFGTQASQRIDATRAVNRLEVAQEKQAEEEKRAQAHRARMAPIRAERLRVENLLSPALSEVREYVTRYRGTRWDSVKEQYAGGIKALREIVLIQKSLVEEAKGAEIKGPLWTSLLTWEADLRKELRQVAMGLPDGPRPAAPKSKWALK